MTPRKRSLSLVTQPPSALQSIARMATVLARERMARSHMNQQLPSTMQLAGRWISPPPRGTKRWPRQQEFRRMYDTKIVAPCIPAAVLLSPLRVGHYCCIQ